MAKKRESRRQKRIHKKLKKEFNWWGFKVHGGPFQMSGVPDLIGCISGLFFAFEVKEPDGDTSDIQDETIEDIKKVGGHVKVVETPEQAVKFVRGVLAKEGRMLAGTKTTAKICRRRNFKPVSHSPDLQTALRKDLHRLRGNRKSSSKARVNRRSSNK